MSRPILPLPSGARSSHSQESSLPPSTPGSEKRQYTKRGAISKIACRSCRKRKTKCNSERPTCSNCAGRAEHCIYDYEESDRSLTHLRDNNENLAEERNTLESMLVALQTDSDEAAAEILRRLRASQSGTNLRTLAHQVHASRVLSEVGGGEGSPFTPSSTLSKMDQYEQLIKFITSSSPAELDEIVRRLRAKHEPASVLAAIRARSLLQPLESGEATASTPTLEEDAFGLIKSASHYPNVEENNPTPLIGQSWTVVTSDQGLIDHLFDLYFSWQHSFFQFFPEELFRKDFVSGQTKYCSSVLVNAICAAGCWLSPRVDKSQDANDLAATSERFFAAALIDLSAARSPSICTVAALALLSQFEGARGELRSMWAYCGQSGRLALDLSLHIADDNIEKAPTEEIKIDEGARAHTFWGCFINDQVTSFTLGRLPQIPINAVTTVRPVVEQSVDARSWVAYYDKSKGVTPGATSSTFREVVSLCMIVNSTLTLFFNPSRTISGGLLLNEYDKYLKWKSSLPEILLARDGSPPHILMMHLLWHSAVLLLFRPFLRAKLRGSEVAPQDVCRQSANAISELFARHRVLYSLTGISAFQIQCLLTACTIHITHIPAIASTTHFVNACNSLHDMVGISEWAKASLNEIKRLVKKWKRILPRDAETALYRNDETPTETPILDGPSTGFQISDLGGNTREGGPSGVVAVNIHDKRMADAPAGSTLRLAKPWVEQPPRKRMMLFAPSASQPAPTLRSNRSSTGSDFEDEFDGVLEFPGLEFSTDDMFDPFMGFGSSWKEVDFA